MTDRRENGLLADAYIPLIALPPSRADTMLDALRRTGIAAYAVPTDVEQPSERDTDPAREKSECDRLYVDSQEQAAAERVLHTELPDLAGTVDGTSVAVDRSEGEGATATAETPSSGEEESGSETSDSDDAVWAELVARFYESDVAAHEALWPDAENITTSEEESPAADGREDAASGASEEASDTTLRDTTPDSARAEHTAEGDNGSDDHFVPPPPPPLPRGDTTSRLAWAGLLGGPLLLLGSMLLGQRLPGWLAFCAVAAFIAGFVVLVVRMGDGPSGGSGPDDGAVV